VRNNPDALVIAVGCYAEVAADPIRKIEGVDLVLGHNEAPHLLNRIAAALKDRQVVPPHPTRPVSGSYEPAHPARALIKVQDGCDNSCAYCLVTIARGPSRSLPANEILAQVRRAEQAGQPEIILTGINLGVFGDAEVGDLAGLTQVILEQTRIPRIRFSSIEPQNFPLKLLDLWPNPRLCRHFHLPLQSGCDRTLARMGRKYRLADFAALLEQIQQYIPEVALTTDVLVGFPGETEGDAERSLRSIATLPLSDLHVFPFSSRPGTAAARLPDPVPPPACQERCQQMHQLARKMARTYRKRFLGRELEVLWDGRSGVEWSGLSDNYLRVVAEKGGNWLGQITRTRILSLHETTLRGQIEDQVPPYEPAPSEHRFQAGGWPEGVPPADKRQPSRSRSNSALPSTLERTACGYAAGIKDDPFSGSNWSNHGFCCIMQEGV
jgi:threonylcarbamoyladenosine tRNA methylthiotransferase MtaB